MTFAFGKLPKVSLNASGSTVTYGDLSAFNYDRNSSLPTRILQHLFKVFRVFFCVTVVNFVTIFGIVLTGCLSVRSAGFTVNGNNLLRHFFFPLCHVFVPLTNYHRLLEFATHLFDFVPKPFCNFSLAQKGKCLY